MTAYYLINLLPSTALNGYTPHEKLYGICNDYIVLKSFGCVSFSLQNEGKLEPRIRKYVFSGYPEGVKGYRLWDRSQTEVKIIISSDVTFNESEMPCLKSESDTLREKQQENTSDESQVDLRPFGVKTPLPYHLN